MGLPVQDEFSVARQAAQWLEILKTAGPVERTAFAKWVKESPAHLREFLLMTALEQEVRAIDPLRRRDIQAILAEPSVNVLHLNDGLEKAPSSTTTSTLSTNRKSRHKMMPVAAIVAIAAIGLALAAVQLLGTHPLRSTYITGVGEQRAVELDDGSVLDVNTHSQVDVNYSAKGRDVRLMEVEALFKVAHDARRPFRVHVAGNTIQAIGTQFNVYREDGHINVAVLEGTVEISADSSAIEPKRIGAGEEARIQSNGAITTQSTPDLARATAWRQRRLAFRGSTLAEMAAEFNRYNRSPKLVVEGDAVRSRQFTANFDADDPQSLLDFLASYDDIVFEKRGNQFVIRPR